MNLNELLLSGTLTYDGVKDLALVFSEELKLLLDDIQINYGSKQNIAAPILLSDGRWALRADLLTEVAEGGLYSQGFGRLPQDQFINVSVEPFDGIKHLIVPEPE